MLIELAQTIDVLIGLGYMVMAGTTTTLDTNNTNKDFGNCFLRTKHSFSP